MKTAKNLLLCFLVLVLCFGAFFIFNKDGTVPNDDTVTIVSGYSIPYTMDELLEQSTAAVRGTVEDISEPFVIRGVGGIGELEHTDYSIHVTEIVRGELTSPSITLRMRGNPYDDTVFYEGAPSLEPGKGYLLFLQKPGIGGGFNTAGDYYYIIGSRQGVYEEIDAQALSSEEADSSEAIFVSQERLLADEGFEAGAPAIRRKTMDSIDIGEIGGTDNGILKWTAFRGKVEDVNKSMPVDEAFKRKELEANCKINLETGMLSEDEYQEALAVLDEYAEIVQG